MITTETIKPFYTVVDGHLFINMHPGQSQVWEDEARIVCLICGAQYGKTSIGPPWLGREMDKCGAGDYLAITATFPLLRLKMLPELRKYFESYLKWGEWKAGEKVFESYASEHGAPAQRIIIGSATSPESLESATAKAAWLDECGQHQFTREAWEAINRRLSISQGRILCTTTPYEFGWFKTELYDRWRQGDKNISVIQGDSKDNPAFPIEEYERQRAILPLWKFNMFYRGVFEKPAGLIYDTFDSETRIIPRIHLPLDWPRYVGHDFGPSNTAAVWFALSPGGDLFAYRTYHEGGLSHYDHVQKWRKTSEGETILKRVGGAIAEDGQREACTAAGWPISKPRERSVEAGINIAYGWFQQGKIYIFSDLTELTDEMASYSYELDDSYEVKQPLAIKDKATFHLMDCIRYLMCEFGPERIKQSEKVKVVSHRNALAIEERPADFSDLRAKVKRH